MVTLEQLEIELIAKQAELESINQRLAQEKQRVSTARRFSPGLLDQPARNAKPVIESQITALQNEIDKKLAQTQEKPTIETPVQEKKGINPLIILGGLGLVLLL